MYDPITCDGDRMAKAVKIGVLQKTTPATPTALPPNI